MFINKCFVPRYILQCLYCSCHHLLSVCRTFTPQLFLQFSSTWKVTSMSATRNVTSAWHPRSLDEDIFKMELHSGFWRPSVSSNLYKTMSVSQKKMTFNIISHTTTSTGYFDHSAHTEDTIHSSAPFFAQHAVVGVKPVDQLLRGHHRESVLQQQKKIKEFSVLQ